MKSAFILSLILQEENNVFSAIKQIYLNFWRSHSLCCLTVQEYFSNEEIIDLKISLYAHLYFKNYYRGQICPFMTNC